MCCLLLSFESSAGCLSWQQLQKRWRLLTTACPATGAEPQQTGRNWIVDALKRNVQIHPHWPVYRFLDSNGNVADFITCYGALHTAQSVAAYLLGPCGLRAGDRVALVYPPGAQFCPTSILSDLMQEFLHIADVHAPQFPPKWVCTSFLVQFQRSYRHCTPSATCLHVLMSSLAVWAERSYHSCAGLEFVKAMWGCLFADIVAVPVCPPDPTRLQQSLPHFKCILEDSGAVAILTDRMFHTVRLLRFTSLSRSAETALSSSQHVACAASISGSLAESAPCEGK